MAAATEAATTGPSAAPPGPGSGSQRILSDGSALELNPAQHMRVSGGEVYPPMLACGPGYAEYCWVLVCPGREHEPMMVCGVIDRTLTCLNWS